MQMPLFLKWWLIPESNRGHEDFQSSALPTELTSHSLREAEKSILPRPRQRKIEKMSALFLAACGRPDRAAYNQLCFEDDWWRKLMVCL